MKRKKMELLAPAGSPEKMKYAFHFGADAVYAGIPDFSMRRRINPFTEKSLQKGIEYAHKKKKKFYVTLNIYAHNIHVKKIIKHIKFLKIAKPDAIILSDPGILNLVKKYASDIDIHISTQANATNWQAVKFWKEQGVKRVILGREVTLKEMKEIKKRVPRIELETFVHGAMCMSYSGRCILSKWMAGRSANLGDCAQPCRWKYHKNKDKKMKGVKDDRDEFEMEIEEDMQGTYIFNSRDMNLLSYLKEIQKAGIISFKIEGRNKSVYYLATVVRAYRKVIDSGFDPNIIKQQQKQLDKLVHRGYTTGFIFEKEPEHNFSDTHEKAEYEFVGEVVGKKGDLIQVKVHNALYRKHKVEAITPEKNILFKIKNIYNEDMEKVKSGHGGQEKTFYLEVDKQNIEPLSLIMRKI